MRIFVFLATLTLFAGVTATAEAKCFGFRGQSIRVCVEGHDNAARRTATSVCEDVTGSSCSVSGDSGSTCQRSSSIRCYDASGEEQRRIELDD